MPLYMDLHIGQGVTAEDVAKAHQLDLEIQHEFKCNCLTYWFDETRSNVYCLIEAPNKEAVVQLHNKAHEQLPDEIIEVDKRVVKAFLGRVIDPLVVDYMIDKKIKVFNDPAFRVILNVSMLSKKMLIYKLGAKMAVELFLLSKEIILKIVKKYNGVESDIVFNEFIATFDSCVPAVQCAIDLADNLMPLSTDIDLKIAIHAGNPVDGDGEIFGTTLKISRFMCNYNQGNQIYASNTVRELVQASGIKIDEHKLGYISATNEVFLKELTKAFYNHWQNPVFDIDFLCKAMSTSVSRLYRKSMDVTGKSSKRLLLDFRLAQALKMLDQDDKNISEVAFDCGFNNAAYFAKCFQKHYGLKPMDYKTITTNL